jgi:hypothetical protein
MLVTEQPIMLVTEQRIMKTYQLRCARNAENPQVWEVVRSDDEDVFYVGLVLLSLESSKKFLFFEPSTILGPPWISAVMEKWLSSIKYDQYIDPQLNIKIYFYRKDLEIIEEVPGTAVSEFESEDSLILNLQLERRSSLSKPNFYGGRAHTEFESAAKFDRFESKLEDIFDSLSKIKDKNMNLEARLISIEKDDYVKSNEYQLWKLVTKDNFRGVLLLMVLFAATQTVYTDVFQINKVVRQIWGLPSIDKIVNPVPDPRTLPQIYQPNGAQPP